MRSARRLVVEYGGSGLLFLGVLLVWVAVVRLFQIPNYLIPEPIEILQSYAGGVGGLWEHARMTLTESVIGYVIGNALGVLIAMVMVESPWIERSLYPYLIAVRAVPIIVVLPLFIIWFGFNIWPIVGGVVLLVFFPTLVNTLQGLKSASEPALQLFRSLNGTRWQTLWYLKFYTALPHIFASLRITVANALIASVVGEWIASDKGLGQVVLQANQFFDTVMLFRTVFAIAFIGIVWFALIALLEARVVHWRRVEL